MGLGDISADVDIIENACAMESIVDELLLEHWLPNKKKKSIVSCRLSK